jgi:dethiobiotin synthetase
VVGTGTGVGKTHVACALLLAARSLGWDCVGLKPIETGVENGRAADHEALRTASSAPLGDPPFRFRDPISPHLAARRAGVAIDLAPITAWVELQSARLVIIETAGGLLSPLGPTMTNLDLAIALQPQAVLVTSINRLGVLHDVAAVLLAMASRGLVAGAIALNASETSDASTGTNAAELQALHGVPVHTLPRAAVGASATLESASRLLDRLA